MKRIVALSILLICGVAALAQSPVIGKSFKANFTIDGERVSKECIYTHHDTIHGKIRAVYADDTTQLAVICNFRNGKRYGLYQTYYPNGNLCLQGVYSANKRDGDWAWYSSKGEVEVKGKYRDGIMHGFWAFREKGCYGKMKAGKKHGKWYCHKDTEKQCMVWYSNGELNRGEECEDFKGLDLEKYSHKP